MVMFWNAHVHVNCAGNVCGDCAGAAQAGVGISAHGNAVQCPVIPHVCSKGNARGDTVVCGRVHVHAQWAWKWPW